MFSDEEWNMEEQCYRSNGKRSEKKEKNWNAMQ